MCVRSHECVAFTDMHTYTCMVHLYHSACVAVRGELLGVTFSFHLVDSAEQMQLLRLCTLWQPDHLIVLTLRFSSPTLLCVLTLHKQNQRPSLVFPTTCLEICPGCYYIQCLFLSYCWVNVHHRMPSVMVHIRGPSAQEVRREYQEFKTRLGYIARAVLK